MSYYGDFLLGATVRIAFNTVSGSGVPTALTSGAVAIRKDGADVSPSGGVTLNVGVDSDAGQNELVVTMATDQTTFAAGHEYKAYLSAGTVGSTSVVGIYLGEWSVQNRFHNPGAAGIDITSLSPTLAALQIRGYLVSTGTTSGPVTADFYHVAGLFGNVPYYQSSTLGTTVYIWTDGTVWNMTTTAPGVSLPGGYFKTASSATAIGPYTAQGSATGTPVVAAHGNAILAAYQPELATTASQVGTATAALVLATPAHPIATNASGFVTSTNGGGGGGSSPAFGVTVAGSTASSIILSGLPVLTGNIAADYTGIKIIHGPTGLPRFVSGTPTYNTGTLNYTFTLGTGTGENGPLPAAPSVGDLFYPMP